MHFVIAETKWHSCFSIQKNTGWTRIPRVCIYLFSICGSNYI